MFSEPVDFSPTFKPTELNYQLNINPQITQLQLTPIVSNPASTIRISRNGVAVGTTNSVITLNKDTSITIAVSAPNQRPAQYQFTVNHLRGITILGIPNETIDEGELIILDAFHSLDVPEDQISYRWTQTAGKAILPQADNEKAALFLTIPADYVAMSEDYAGLGLNITVTDGKTTLNKNISLMIAKKDNGNIAVGSPSLSIVESTAPEIDLSEDPDGTGNSLSYQWQHRLPSEDAEWTDIDRATDKTYTIPTEAEWYTEYRALISYTDGQGYQTIATSEATRYSPETVIPNFAQGVASEQPYPEDAVPQRSMHSQDALCSLTGDMDGDGIPLSTDIDNDNNGLIEICDLEDLNAIRNNLTGQGSMAQGCHMDGCNGYELARSLDFNDDGSYSSINNKVMWVEGEGWQPIGNAVNPFTAIFEGNNHTISNLMINRPLSSQLGLFSVVGNGARISNIGLLNVSVNGNSALGGLAGINAGRITNSYTSGKVIYSSAIAYGHGSGGLVGRNHGAGIIANSYSLAEISGRAHSGGLVGSNYGNIINSYATGNVTARFRVGGLVGTNLDGGQVFNSYATGNIYGRSRVGGLVGFNTEGSLILNSYANTDSVRAEDHYAGGLVGENHISTIKHSYAVSRYVSADNSDRARGLVGLDVNGTAIASYWDTDTSGKETSAGGTSKTTVELQWPTTATEIYRDWGSDGWDYGTSQQYPVLKYVQSADPNNPTCREKEQTTTSLPLCGDLLSPVARGLDELEIVKGNLSPSFIVAMPIYRGTVVSKTNEIRLISKALNPNATISITGDNDTSWGKNLISGTTSSSIQLNTNGIIKINIEVNNGNPALNVQYTLYLNYHAYKGKDIDSDNDGLIDINNLEQLNAIRHQLDGSGYRESDTSLKIAAGCPHHVCRGYELMRDLDFNNDDSYSSASNRTVWTTGSGWEPIGSIENPLFERLENSPFTGIFEGNGYTISNLNINRDTYGNVGLFGFIGANSTVTNVGLLNVNIKGHWRVGGLAGGNKGEIRNSYTAGTVVGVWQHIGGLVGANIEGGVVANSYSSCAARNSGTGEGVNVGGLVGRNRAGIINNSYATGAVSGNSQVGGLVGLNDEGGKIDNSYATGMVLGSSEFGGLVGANSHDSIVNNSYWDTQTSGIRRGSSDIGTGKTTMELQLPKGAVGIYSNWHSDNWSFGTSEQYPVLKYARSSGGSDPDCNGNSPPPKCNTLLPNQKAVLLTQLTVSPGTLDTAFDPKQLEYSVDVAFAANQITLSAAATDATIKIVNNTRGTEYASAEDAVNEMIPLTITGPTKITITVSSDNQATEYTVTVKHNAGGTDADKLPEIMLRQLPGNTIDEGDKHYPENISLDVTYQWQRVSPLPVAVISSSTYPISADFVAVGNERELELIFAARNSHGTTRTNITLTVNKINNGFAEVTATLTGTTLTAVITKDDPDRRQSSAIQYQWQRLDSGNSGVDVANTHSYKIPEGTTDTTRYRVQISYTDGQDYTQTTMSNVVIYRDIDQDKNGLINISTLEQLDAIRYQPDGTGYRESRSTMKITAGCPVDGCIGYELTRDLDFIDDDSYSTTANKMTWTTGRGWKPIGSDLESFSSIFKGNGHTISNLMINRGDTDNIGLFSTILPLAKIDGVNLYDIRINGVGNIGGLVGVNREGAITNSSVVNGMISSTGDYIGGLVGSNSGTIAGSYASVDVSGTNSNMGTYVGGLVGLNTNEITNSYATGAVDGTRRLGGLVGGNGSTISRINNSYAIGVVSQTTQSGGLSGENLGRITDSYWDTQTSRQTASFGGEGKTTTDLQRLTMPAGIYSGWSPEVWDFGTAEQYPALKYSGNECLGENVLNHCGKLLSGQRPGLLSLELPNNAILLEPFASTTDSYTILTNDDIAEQIVPVAANASAQIETLSDPDNMTIRIVVGEGKSKVTYTLNIKPFTVAIKLDDPLPNRITMPFDEGGTITLQANYESEGLSSMYQWRGDFLATTATVQNVTFNIPEYYVIGGSGINTATGAMRVQVVLSKGEAQVTASHQQVLTINKIDNNEITATMTGRLQKPEINNLRLTAPDLPDNAVDLDGGIDTITYQWQQRASDNETWGDVDPNGNQQTYTIPQTTPFNKQYRVVLGYTDGQGYTQAIDKDIDNPISEAIIFESIDRDNDGLIDILSAASLNAIRNQLTGSGYKTGSSDPEVTAGCPNNTCSGYELRAHIDMAGMDWQPIGDENNPFNARFEGNDYTISNLTMQTEATTHAGLFGATTTETTISRVGLVNVIAVKGAGHVGGLVGLSKGTITESYVIAKTITGGSAVGGLIGFGDTGIITKSYAIVKTINGLGNNIGGLAGETTDGGISDSYARVDTINKNNQSTCPDNMQKLVGSNNGTTIINSKLLGNCDSTAIFNNP